MVNMRELSEALNPYKVFLGQLWAGLPRSELVDCLARNGVAVPPGAGVFMSLGL